MNEVVTDPTDGTSTPNHIYEQHGRYVSPRYSWRRSGEVHVRAFTPPTTTQ
jgi:hypothetical protein